MAEFTTEYRMDMRSSAWLDRLFDTFRDPYDSWQGISGNGYWAPYDFNPTHIRLIDVVYGNIGYIHSRMELLGPFEYEIVDDKIASIGGQFVHASYSYFSDDFKKNWLDWTLSTSLTDIAELLGATDPVGMLFSGNDVIRGSGWRDTLLGFAGNDQIYGGAENDLIDGGAGNDILGGGLGDDILIGGEGADMLSGGPGKDTASYADAKNGVVVDVLQYGLNQGEAAGDRLSSIEVVIGSRFDDRISGGSGYELLQGGAGNDVLRGGNGNDTLVGGLGADFLIGNKGADLYIYSSVSESPNTKAGRDTIIAFSPKQGDKIDLSAIDARSPTPIRNEVFKFIGKKAFSYKEGQLRYERKKADTYIYGDVDGDAKADFSIKLQDFKAELKSGDFVL